MYDSSINRSVQHTTRLLRRISTPVLLGDRLVSGCKRRATRLRKDVDDIGIDRPKPSFSWLVPPPALEEIGSKIHPRECVTHPTGCVINPSGCAIHPRGCATHTRGCIFHPKGYVIHPRGCVIYPKGCVINPRGPRGYAIHIRVCYSSQGVCYSSKGVCYSYKGVCY